MKSRTPIPKQSAKRLAAIADGTYKPAPRKPIVRKPFGKVVAGSPAASKLIARAFGKGKKSDRSKAMEMADKWFSQFIRLRDAGEDGRVKCVTCSHTDHWLYLQCGHYVTRGHMATRFDERNSNAQCRGCNYNGGKHLKHAIAIDDKYGDGTSDMLEQKGLTRCSRTLSDLQFMAKAYKERVENIREKSPDKFRSAA